MIYDITQPLFECVVFPGDRAPERFITHSISKGDKYNLTELSMCAHNGTHVDAPYHFVNSGKTIDEIPLDIYIGRAYVAEFAGDVSAQDAKILLAKMKSSGAKKLLIKGKATLTEDAAKVFAASDMELYGNESQTVGSESAPMAVHLILLGKGMVLLEGVRLGHVPEGAYLLHCAPLNLTRAEGSPCRATLMTL